MNTRDYITSGILEEFALSAVSDQERREVECLSKIYPEIKEELNRLEFVMEQYALAHQTPPPAELKEKIFAKLDFKVADTDIADTDSTPVIAFNNNTQTTTTLGTQSAPMWSRLAVAASVLLAVLSGYLFSKNQKDTQLNQNQMADLQQSIETKNGLIGLFQSPANTVVKLKGLPKSPESEMVVFWDKTAQTVKIQVAKLPVPPKGFQYQLWTLVNGKPNDCGVFEVGKDAQLVQQVKNAQAADTFAVTLEKEGGVASPTLSELYVIGDVGR